MGYTQNVITAALPCLLLFSGGASARSLRAETSIRKLTTDGCTEGMTYHLIEAQSGHCGSPCNHGTKTIMQSAEDCAKHCLETDGCKSAFFRLSDGLCSMKNVKWDSPELDITDDPQKRNILIAPCDKPDPPPDWKMCLTAKDYDVAWGVSYTCGSSCNLGSNPEVKNQDECADACLKDGGCKCAFYDPKANKCCLKNLRCDHPAMGMSYNAPAKYNAIMKCAHKQQCVGGPYNSASPSISEMGETVQYITDKTEELCVCTSKNFEPAYWMCVPLKPVMCEGGPHGAAVPAESADGTKVITADQSEECTCKVDKEKRTAEWECEQKAWSPCDSADDCVATYGTCGGTNRNGRTTRCCSNDDRCILQNEYYAQCVPRTQPVTSEWIGTILSDCPNGNTVSM